MCGIAGYVGTRQAPEVILGILQNLENRGYDSAGMVVRSLQSPAQTLKAIGRIDNLREKLALAHTEGTVGLGHTRWATHGEPSEVNSHPQWGGKEGRQRVAVVHNGVIENFGEIKSSLQAKGYVFHSQTDTECIAHLIDSHLDDSADPFIAVRDALSELKGSYALGIMIDDLPHTLIAARSKSPLVIGLGTHENFISSDLASLRGKAKTAAILREGDIVAVTSHELKVVHSKHSDPLPIQEVTGEADDLELAGFTHFMQKEIWEQPATLARALEGRLDDANFTAFFEELKLDPEKLAGIKRIILTGCGTSWHAGLIGEFLIESLAKIPVEVEYASEFRYRHPPIANDTMIFVISQSGETADTLAALQECKRRGFTVAALCNVPSSTIASEANGVLHLKAGPEIGVASTKAFTSQVMVLTLLALALGRMRNLSPQEGEDIVKNLRRIPELVKETLKCEAEVRRIAATFTGSNNALFLGRGFNFPVALEGALKLKEISYIHAEGYPAAEMKHGPIALVDENMPTIFIMPPLGFLHDKVMSNVQEIKARKGRIIAVACEDDKEITEKADEVIRVPSVPEYLQPLITAIPLQLLAYHVAVLRGLNVDRPRNLAKSVTVE